MTYTSEEVIVCEKHRTAIGDHEAATMLRSYAALLEAMESYKTLGGTVRIVVREIEERAAEILKGQR